MSSHRQDSVASSNSCPITIPSISVPTSPVTLLDPRTLTQNDRSISTWYLFLYVALVNFIRRYRCIALHSCTSEKSFFFFEGYFYQWHFNISALINPSKRCAKFLLMFQSASTIVNKHISLANIFTFDHLHCFNKGQLGKMSERWNISKEEVTGSDRLI